MTKPAFTLAAAMTIDGKIAKSDTHFSSWTSPEDKRLLHRLEDESDVIIIGRKTYELAKAPLSKRNCIVFTRSVTMPQAQSDKLTYFNPDVFDLAQHMLEKHLKKGLILGGVGVHNYFLDRDQISELYLTIEPIVFGDGLSLFSSMQTNSPRFELESVETINSSSVLLHYNRKS